MIMDEELNQFFKDQSKEDWLSILPTYQTNTIKKLMKKYTPDAAASAWLQAGFNQTSPFGADKTPQNKDYFHLLKIETHKFLCGDPRYQEDRSKFKGLLESGKDRTTIVSFISAVIGNQIGMAGAVIAPALILIFMSISKVALNAWCQLQV